MTRQSLDRLRGHPSTSPRPDDPHALELASQPYAIPRLSINEWRTSADERRSPPAAENPFQDPSHISPVHQEEAPIHPQTAHTHQNHQSHHEFQNHDIESQQLPKAPRTPSITALPLHLPHHPTKTEHPQKFHRIFLVVRLVVQVILFVLALIGYLLKYPKTITYSGMLTGGSLAFVVLWTVLLVFVYFTEGPPGGGGMRMSRWSSERGQWKKAGRMVMFDLMIVFIWLLVCWGNTAFAKGVLEQIANAAKKAAGTGSPGKPSGMGKPGFTPPVLNSMMGAKPTVTATAR